MTRLEALKEAEELVNRLTLGPANGKGYHDVSIKGTTLEERTQAILSVADWLLREESACPHVQARGTLTAPPQVDV